jgi:hypothetical protein
MTISAISKTLLQNHATVLHALKNFTHDYNHNSSFKKDFDRIYKLYGGEQEDEVTADALRALVFKKKRIIVELREDMEKMRSDYEDKIKDLKTALNKARSNNIRPRNQQTKIYQAVEGISKLTY